MATAPSFQNLEKVGEPFEENGKEYIYVRTKSGTTRKVRWYEEPMKKIRPRKDALGFVKGYIYLVKGNSYDFKEWLFEHGATYRTFWGWSFASDVELPENLPAGLSLVRLDWDKVAYVDEDELKSQSAINDAVAEIMYDPSPSRWQGEVGDRIDRTLTVTKVTELTDGYFGPSTFYLFTDGENEYTWTTAAKKLDLGSTWQVRGTIKALQKYKGKEQTVLTRCRVE
jgi:hypothetical protein